MKLLKKLFFLTLNSAFLYSMCFLFGFECAVITGIAYLITKENLKYF